MSRRVWPARLAVREGVATARAGRWTSAIVIVAAAWAVAAPGAADAVDVTRLADAEQAWIDAGGRVFEVTGARTDGEPNPVPARECDALSRIDGVDAAFALSRTEASGTVAHVPGGRASLYEVTPGAYGFLGAGHTAGGDVLATSGFARRTGVADGDTVEVLRRAGQGAAAGVSDPLTVAVVDPAQMGEEFDGALLLPAPAGAEASVCYVRTDAAHYDAVAAALPTLLAHRGQPAVANPRLYGGDFTVDYTTAYEDRQLRWLWVGAAGVLALLWAMVQWFRRGQVAVYATFGADARARLLMQATEWGVLAGLGAVWGWALGVVGALALGARPEFAFSLVSLTGALTLLGASAVAVLLGLRPTGTLLAALKDH